MSNPFGYQDRRVVVTGAARGVGAALLDVLHALGVGHVTVLDLNEPEGPHDSFFATDLADEQSLGRAIDAIDGPTHALFNNAGVADTQPPHTVMRVNYLALRTLSERLLDQMPEGGAIVNTASLAGHLWRKRLQQIDALIAIFDESPEWDRSLRWFDENAATLDQSPYNFSKEVVERYTLTSARPTIRRGVRTNTVCPGPIDTPLLPHFRQTTSDKVVDWNIREMMGRPVDPREVATVMAFLGSPAASYVNGVNLEIDAGFSAALATGQVDFTGRT